MAKIIVSNPADLGSRRAVRSEEVEGLVDTGATMLVLPGELCQRLGLPVVAHRNVKYADGRVAKRPLVGPVKIEILGREMHCDAIVEATGTTALIGQIPLEGLDLVVDPKSRDVRVNPESPDIPLMDLMAAS